MKYYTGIGSRKTPKEVCLYMADVAAFLAKDNWTLRSGAADGADTAFELGATLSRPTPPMKEIYLPWKGFNKNSEQRKDLPVSILHMENVPHNVVQKAEEIVSRIHPRWTYLPYGAKRLHTRNVFQVLGQDLNTPSEIVICWTDGGGETGGTATAIKVARNFDIPVFNLYNEVDKFALKTWLSL